MILTKKQELGVKKALERYRNKEKYIVISGYAGVGKSTLVKFIIEALDVDKDKVCYATFTGKAAEVLRKKGNKNAITLHKLLYNFIPIDNGRFIRTPKEFIDYSIVVVDEISMAPKEMVELLFTHNCFVICLGDPFQLPPINKNEDNHLLDNPHIFLDEIMRQAQDSEIIKLSMDIRENKSISRYMGENLRVYERHEFVSQMMTWADQIIVATNNTRNALNARIRQNLGFGADPCVGDKIICHHNYWDYLDDSKNNPLVNGTIGYIRNLKEKRIIVPKPTFFNMQKKSYEILDIDFENVSNEKYSNLIIDKSYLENEEKTLDWKDEGRINKMKRSKSYLPLIFDYGYAITCHRAQGSEFNNVLVIEESFPFSREEHARWLYTACTRSSERLILIKN